MVVAQADGDEAEALFVLQCIHQRMRGLLAAHVDGEYASGTKTVARKPAQDLMVGVRAQTRVVDALAHRLHALGEDLGAASVLGHA